MSALTKAASDVLAERQRQIEREGWTPKHDDDEHRDGSLTRAAAVYCLCAEGPPAPGTPSELYQAGGQWGFNMLRAIWPAEWVFRPKDRRRNLVRAGALILAEIERLDRATSGVNAPGEGQQ
jgi:hypothetical protein